MRVLILAAALLTLSARPVVGANLEQASESWAALAYNSSTGTWGAADGYDTLLAAEGAAQAYCGGSGCLTVGWTDDGYLAMAIGDNGWAWDGGDNQREARRAALNDCGGFTTNCQIVATVHGSNH